MKAFLLLQAHMSRISLPITDYVGDQTSVLDQAIRIIQASIDVLTELGHLSSCLEFIKLLQCIKSARWPTDHPASILPGVGVDTLKNDTSDLTLAKIGALGSPSKVTQLAKKLSVAPHQQPRFAKAVAQLPNLAVSVPETTALSVSVDLRRLNPLTERDAHVYAPRFPKPQNEGWFVVLADAARDEVIAVKRAGWSQGAGRSVAVGSKPTARANFKVPEAAQGRKLDVLVVSDAYVGLEYRVGGIDIPTAPVVDDDVDKSKKVQAQQSGGASRA